jgi:hypothetical protein
MLATRELWEWLRNWENLVEYTEEDDLHYEIVFPSDEPPDTNVLIFCVKGKNQHSLDKMNDFTSQVYDKFAIQVELGDRKYSYSQPFFISKTTFNSPEYQFETLEPFFSRIKLKTTKKIYLEKELVILRATVMNPYINSMKLFANQNIIKEFVLELHKAARSISSIKK